MITFFKHRPQIFVGVIATIISVLAWAIFYRLDLTLNYNDAMSHLNVARLVVDNLQPGMSQLGSVWLPMSHLLTLPFIWNDFLWHTGLAGSIISMGSFILSAIGVYKIIILLVESKWAGVLGALAFTVCLNMLYLQATPLTEALYVVAFIYAMLYLIKYLRYDLSKSLIALGAISAAGILIRYDAWFVAAVIAVVIIVNELAIRRRTIQAAIGYVALYAFPIAFAVFLWLGWNLLIFGDPLYSFIGPYSARAQQALIESSSGLVTKYNIGVSSWAYLLSVLQNVGILLSMLGAIGWGLFLLCAKKASLAVRVGAFIGMTSIIVFNVIALFLGFSILNLPELNWNPSGTLAGQLFNVRYGILALPFAAVGVGLLFAHFKTRAVSAVAVILSALILQFFLTYTTGIITVEDGRIGSSAFVNQDIATAIRTTAKPGDRVIMSTSSYNAVAFKSGLRLDAFIHEGVSRSWNAAISKPDEYGELIVMSNNDVGEPVYTSLVMNQKSAFLEKYDKVYTGTYASLYKRKE